MRFYGQETRCLSTVFLVDRQFSIFLTQTVSLAGIIVTEMYKNIDYRIGVVWSVMRACCMCVALFLILAVSTTQSTAEKPLPIVFAYTVVPAVCQYGLPEYIVHSLEHNIFTQPDCEVVLLTNVGECANLAESVKNITGLTIIDSTALTSNRTAQFHNASINIFQSDSHGELWITSALRFFVLEDMMTQRGYHEILHAEADNLLYGRLTTVLPLLRQHYPMAVTPLNTRKTFFTASVFWVAKLEYLVHFNDFLLDLATNNKKGFDKYLDWLRPWACCKAGGIRPNAQGMGIKLFAVNEMSMLAYYHEIYPGKLLLLQGVPAYAHYAKGRHIPDVTQFSPNGSEIKASTGMALWDGGSWGQFIGGTARKKGRDRGFTDGTHIGGTAIRISNCRPAMRCANMSEFGYVTGHPPAPASGVNVRCYTAPIVHCAEGEPFWPLWNLHVHSKHTNAFRSELCSCHGNATLVA